jgi:hypothetical protein
VLVLHRSDHGRADICTGILGKKIYFYNAALRYVSNVECGGPSVVSCLAALMYEIEGLSMLQADM